MPAASVRLPFVFMVKVPAECVKVPINPVKVALRTVILAEMLDVPEPEFTSKIALSEEPGTEALLEPPEVADQLVLLVAFQLVDAPPPTQYLSAASDIFGKQRKKIIKNMYLKYFFIYILFLF